jgi:hypothetical protein
VFAVLGATEERRARGESGARVAKLGFLIGFVYVLMRTSLAGSVGAGNIVTQPKRSVLLWRRSTRMAERVAGQVGRLRLAQLEWNNARQVSAGIVEIGSRDPVPTHLWVMGRIETVKDWPKRRF